MPTLAKLKTTRESKFLTQRDLAKKAGVSPATIVQLEAGRTEAKFATVRKLAEALGVAPEELL